MEEININCQPSLTEEHLHQLHAALMSEEPGSRFSICLSNEDDFSVPKILNLIGESDWDGLAEPQGNSILITAQRKSQV